MNCWLDESVSVWTAALAVWGVMLFTVAEVTDSGARQLEVAAVDKPVKTESGLEIGPEFVGAAIRENGHPS